MPSGGRPGSSHDCRARVTVLVFGVATIMMIIGYLSSPPDPARVELHSHVTCPGPGPGPGPGQQQTGDSDVTPSRSLSRVTRESRANT